MAMSDPLLPIQGLEAPDDPPTEVEVEQARAERPDPEGDGPGGDGEPPTTATGYRPPDEKTVDPADL